MEERRQSLGGSLSRKLFSWLNGLALSRNSVPECEVLEQNESFPFVLKLAFAAFCRQNSSACDLFAVDPKHPSGWRLLTPPLAVSLFRSGIFSGTVLKTGSSVCEHIDY